MAENWALIIPSYLKYPSIGNMHAYTYDRNMGLNIFCTSHIFFLLVNIIIFKF